MSCLFSAPRMLPAPSAARRVFRNGRRATGQGGNRIWPVTGRHGHWRMATDQNHVVDILCRGHSFAAIGVGARLVDGPEPDVFFRTGGVWSQAPLLLYRDAFHATDEVGVDVESPGILSPLKLVQGSF